MAVTVYNCGSETAEYYRMHSRETGEKAAEILDERNYSRNHKIATCNVCENAQVIESQTVVDYGDTPLLESDRE